MNKCKGLDQKIKENRLHVMCSVMVVNISLAKGAA